MFSPQRLLTASARERCIACLRGLPEFVLEDVSPKKKASVLVPMCVINNEVHLLYTTRSTNLSSHAGQVSFPGGKMDKDENVIETALRETEEEIGVPPEAVEVWSAMSSVQGRDKNMLITPVVGLIKNFENQTLIPNVYEVEEIFTVPMSALCDRKNHAHLEFEKTILPVFLYEKHKIWGITGFITNFFLQSFLPTESYQCDFLRKKFELHELLPSKL
ncbi:mitochondrial coenzyme A diphosphatase NUDT8-like [Pieris brassicae]|uniref:Nudix hydrolase domain-containing protein n=1 Tax=Pieris brassicae TaxID=7116 RepID=A0A9P0TE12_PIEBR|nr:mitochondrial coenzyme A diphosphatase NUDT8-like [Pieris brassicae]CAH4029913.1 unnamed protein product [Pieris brassicae]